MLPEYIFIDDRVSDVMAIVITDPTTAASTPAAGVICGDPTVAVNVWDCSRNGDASKLTTAAQYNNCVKIDQLFFDTRIISTTESGNYEECQLCLIFFLLLILLIKFSRFAVNSNNFDYASHTLTLIFLSCRFNTD